MIQIDLSETITYNDLHALVLITMTVRYIGLQGMGMCMLVTSICMAALYYMAPRTISRI